MQLEALRGGGWAEVRRKLVVASWCEACGLHAGVGECPGLSGAGGVQLQGLVTERLNPCFPSGLGPLEGRISPVLVPDTARGGGS